MRQHFILSALVLFCCAGCATHAATSGRVVIQDQDTTVDVSINAHDRAVIRDYYQSQKVKHKKKGLPPGLAKRGGNLPPGLAKRDRLPPGLQTEPLPAALDTQLTRLPGSYIRVRVGQDIVLMNRNTRVVFDVVHDIAI